MLAFSGNSYRVRQVLLRYDKRSDQHLEHCVIECTTHTSSMGRSRPARTRYLIQKALLREALTERMCIKWSRLCNMLLMAEEYQLHTVYREIENILECPMCGHVHQSAVEALNHWCNPSIPSPAASFQNDVIQLMTRSSLQRVLREVCNRPRQYVEGVRYLYTYALLNVVSSHVRMLRT